MDRKKLLIAGGLIVVIIVFAVGVFVIIPATDNSTDNNSTANSSEDWLFFDNSTPEATAISIARLNKGETSGFYSDLKANASLTSDGKYWIVELNDETSVRVDAKTLKSKKDNGTWRSLDELKASYIAEIQSPSQNGGLDKPKKIIMNGKEIWKVPVYYYHECDPVKTEYVYVDVVTGKSKNELYDDVFYSTGKKGGLTLKEVDDKMSKIGKDYPGMGYSGRDALRDLYHE